MDRFKKKLIEQISFLESSCERYDKGHTHEALRIAISLRIIFYSSNNNCTSILKHMKAENISLLSTGGMPKEKAQKLSQYYGLGLFQLSNSEESEYRPSLGDGSPFNNKYLPLKDWWHECVYVLEHGKLITRFVIMKSAADKDGGAHVDESLEPLYASLAEEGSLGTFKIMNDCNGIISSKPITNANHVALRQMAYEVLSSPDFIKLADSEL
ncbi:MULTISPECIES: hypothetical protein [Pantoea]|jgi:hypothetical protein|uniref:hypothetical protein n=1 Tax=Pantoea TaxID=53335 RepID=UPI0011C3F449|nr:MULTISPECIES: hypothetical protein [Pantoea]MBZ6387381.1 hypothetical protein [Pantoea piersonii]MBZ6400692.1 hypothetical protein [Pantoea piersonii]MBZ6408696.1 hypothetical protein [Pantoea piersonii]NYB00578.1 hypothetical protein [Pantoea piersonii]NYB08125.1 hypothetical protein [Pantoea piersonii]